MKQASKIILALLAFMLVIPTITKAESRNWRIYSYVTKAHVIPIGFAKAPANMIFERSGLAEFDDGEIASILMRGSGKLTPSGGSVEGFVQYTFEDTATFVVKWQANVTKEKEKELNTFTGNGTYVIGTGRFDGIQGDVSFTGRYVTPYSKEKGTHGDMIVDVKSNYTLPSK